MFRPHLLHDAILLYNSFSNDGNGDFISIAIKDEFVEFRYDSGSGTGRFHALSCEHDVRHP